MEKRISYFEFQSVKSVAKAIDPMVREKEKLEAQVKELAEKYKAVQAEIGLYEAGVVKNIGFHVTDLVKKIIEPTGKTDAKTGKPIKVTKYLPTEIVSYDEATKEYVITVPENEPVNVNEGSDNDIF